MTTDDRSAPVACTLTSAGLAVQRDRWERLTARAMTERSQTTDGLRICFRAESDAEDELRALVAVEQECCRWADWTVTSKDGQIVLTVRAAGDGITTLHGMFTWMSG
jgi:hypothetical protein